jgi:hypothetical protein
MCLHHRCQNCRGRSLNGVVYTHQPECCVVLFVTASCKGIFLFPKTPIPALGPTYRASSLGTGVICRSYSYRRVKLTTPVPRLRIIGAVPSLRLSTGWTVQRRGAGRDISYPSKLAPRPQCSFPWGKAAGAWRLPSPPI